MYPPTNEGIARAVIETINHVESAEVLTHGPGPFTDIQTPVSFIAGPPTLHITLKRRWWTLWLRWRVRRQVQRIIHRYGAPGMLFDIRIN